jgi:hypothetical protein
MSATLKAAFGVLHRASRSDRAVAASLRKDRLRRLLAMFREHSIEFEAAISLDFGHRSAHETELAESLIVESANKRALHQLDHWIRPRSVATQLPFLPGGWRRRRLPRRVGLSHLQQGKAGFLPASLRYHRFDRSLFMARGSSAPQRQCAG